MTTSSSHRFHLTNEYGVNALVDPHEVSAALKKYRDKMYTANYLQAHNVPGHNHAAAATQAKAELKADLERASQKQQPVVRRYGI